MFVPVWLVFLGSGTLMAVIVLVWSIRSHQFEDQDRARYIPLVGMEPEELAQEPRHRRGATYWGLVSIFVVNAVVIALTLALALLHM